MKQCVVCRTIYNDEDQYCLKCRRPLKKMEKANVDEAVQWSLNREKKARANPIHITDETKDQIPVILHKDDPVLVPTCPTCGSSNIKHISGWKKGFSIAFAGIYSNYINKTFECENCGYTW